MMISVDADNELDKTTSIHDFLNNYFIILILLIFWPCCVT